MKVLGISGSLRRDSYNTKLLRAAEERLSGYVEFEIFDGLKAIPPYDEDDDVPPTPKAVAAFREAVAEADAILIATPEYNSSIPGQLKNAIDWLSRPLSASPFLNKAVAVASSGAFGGVWSQAELRKVIGATGGRVVDGRLVEQSLREQLDEVVRALLDETRARELAAAG